MRSYDRSSTSSSPERRPAPFTGAFANCIPASVRAHRCAWFLRREPAHGRAVAPEDRLPARSSSRIVEGSLPLAHLGRLGDDEIIAHLVRVKGIGRWTVHMFLMFRLGRPDVLPELDLGIQNAVQRAYGLRKRPSPGDVLRIGAGWRPYASVASGICGDPGTGGRSSLRGLTARWFAGATARAFGGCAASTARPHRRFAPRCVETSASRRSSQ